jgi:galactokinase
LAQHPRGHSSAPFADRGGGPDPSVVVWAPGRVNLIGEHIDYSLLPVLPMAIQLGTSLTVAPREDRMVRLRNADSAYADVEIPLSLDVDPGDEGEWGNYARGVVQALVRNHGITVGADIALESDLPIAAGLSSSTALSGGVALALLGVNGRDMDRVELAVAVARAERYTGTHGGEMDQAAILCGRSGHALHMSFQPLHIRPVRVPADWIFLVAHSGVVAEKSGPAQITYNARTMECREALHAVWASMAGGDPPHRDYRPLLAMADPDHLIGVATGVLTPPLLARFRHTVGEALRVTEAEKALAESDLDTFGRLMEASHQSLRDDFEVSTPELDRIVDVAIAAGAAGARLTGAGLGGAALILCAGHSEEGVRESLASGYYGPRGVSASEDVLFRAVPSGGATVTRLD